MPEWRKILEAEDSDFGAIHRGEGRLEPADRGREWVSGHPDGTAAAVALDGGEAQVQFRRAKAGAILFERGIGRGRLIPGIGNQL